MAPYFIISPNPETFSITGNVSNKSGSTITDTG